MKENIKTKINGLKTLKNPLLSKIVDSKRNIEKMGTKIFSPGLLNQRVKVIDSVKLNINTLAYFLLAKRDNKKLITSERIK